MIENLIKINPSAHFLLHPLGFFRKDLLDLGFVSSFLQDVDRPEYDGLNVVFILFHVTEVKKDKFRFFVEKERVRTPLFIDEYDYEGGYTVLVYEFPESLADDFHRVLRGEYSRLSPQYLSTLPPYFELRDDAGRKLGNVTPFQRWVIEKNKDFKDQYEAYWGIEPPLGEEDEIWEIPIVDGRPINKEILDIERIKSER